MKVGEDIVAAFLSLPRSERESVKKLLDDAVKDQLIKFELSEQESVALKKRNQTRQDKIKQKYSNKFASGLMNLQDQDGLTPAMIALIDDTIDETFAIPKTAVQGENLS